MRILSRSALSEAARLFIFYVLAYSLLTTLAVSAPLLHKGAPFSAVLYFIPFQLLYTAPILVPLALCTAVLSQIGRMREDGELTALRASGISALSVMKGMLPLIIAIALLMSLLQHILLPDISLKIRAGRSDLVRQGISTRINRGEPIWKNSTHGQVLMAKSTDGLQLFHIVAHNSAPDREIFVYAPQGTWRYRDDLHLECQQVRFMDIRRNQEGTIDEVSTGTVPLSSQIIQSGGISSRQLEKPDVKSFTVLSHDIDELKQRLRDLRTPGYSIHDRPHRHTQEALRSHQLTWHMRMAIPAAMLAYFLLAGGLALSMPVHNRLLAVCTGMLLIMANVLPGMLTVSGMGQYLRFNPGILVWLPLFFTSIAGGLLLWRRR